MISRDAKKVLVLAKKSTDKTVFYRALEESFGWDFYKAKSICSQLVEQGYASVRMGHPKNPFAGEESPCGIVLTEEGREHWKYTLEKVGKLVLCDIVLPIVVAVITTLITLWVQGYFSSNNP